MYVKIDRIIDNRDRENDIHAQVYRGWMDNYEKRICKFTWYNLNARPLKISVDDRFNYVDYNLFEVYGEIYTKETHPEYFL